MASRQEVTNSKDRRLIGRSIVRVAAMAPRERSPPERIADPF